MDILSRKKIFSFVKASTKYSGAELYSNINLPKGFNYTCPGSSRIIDNKCLLPFFVDATEGRLFFSLRKNGQRYNVVLQTMNNQVSELTLLYNAGATKGDRLENREITWLVMSKECVCSANVSQYFSNREFFTVFNSSNNSLKAEPGDL